MLEDLTRTRLSHRRKISTDAIPALREKLGTGSNKAVNWIGNQIRKVRRGSDSESDDSSSLWGTSFEIYPDEPLGPATALAEGYVPLSRFHSQKRSIDLTNRCRTVQADQVFSLDQSDVDERQPLIESDTSNIVLPSTPRTIEGTRKRRQKTHPEEPRRLLAPVELYDRPWSGLITDDPISSDPYSKFEDNYSQSSNPKSTSSMRKPFQFPARRPPQRSETDLSTHNPSRLQNWFTKPKSETNFGSGSSNRRDTEKTFGTSFKNPYRHATTPSQSKMSFRVLLPHP